MVISIILHKLTAALKVVPPLPVVFVLSAVGANLIYVYEILPAKLPEAALAEEVNAAELNSTALINDANLAGLETADSPEEAVGYVLVDRSSFLNPSTLSAEVTPERNGLLAYKVEEGDTVSTIAAKFGISVNTIIWANDLTSSGRIKPGDEIVILPVSGVLHKVKSGETFGSIASLHGVEADKIASFNKGTLKAGDTVVVPNARPVSGVQSESSKNKEKKAEKKAAGAASGSGYFISPVANGLNWGKLHDGNAVDIATACGTPIVAAATGVVTETGSPSGWNSGYGGYIKISHSNGTATFYAHNSTNLVGVGDEVGQGSVIAKVGNTGRVSGISGCHVHFGVTGAKNPFVR